MQLDGRIENWAKEEGYRPYYEGGASMRAAIQFARLQGYAEARGINDLRVNSLWRDPARQRELQAQYDAMPGSGPRKPGFLARPATNSKHVRGEASDPQADAVDMVSSRQGEVDQIARWLGLRAGSDFKTPDRGHYDIP